MKIRPHRPSVALAAIACALAACQAHDTATTSPSESARPAIVVRRRLPPLTASAPKYPSAPREDVVDEYHGVTVADPYRWLEDPDAPRTAEWVRAQNAVTQAFLAPIAAREKLKRRLTELWDYERYQPPFERGGRFFMSKNDGLQNQNVLYVAEALHSTPHVLLDPNTLSKDGTIALAGSSVSDDGRYLAYALAEGGSDWNTWRVRDVETGRDLADELRWVKFSDASWLPDSSGFFYSRYDEPAGGEELRGVNYFQKLCFHKLGTPQAQDTLIYERPDQKEWSFRGVVSEDGRWLVIESGLGTDPRNRVFLKQLMRPQDGVFELIGELEARYDFVGNDGSTLWFNTNLDAPRGRLIAIDADAAARSQWDELVPQGQETLESVSLVGDHFICRYLKDARTLVRVHALDGAHVRDVDLPGLGTALGFHGRRADRRTFYSYASFSTPSSVFTYDLATGASQVLRKPEIAFDPSTFVTEQIFYESKDGARIPMFLSYRKGLKRDGANPTLLYGYGGFNVSITPSFSPARIAWMELGGVFAVANLRGGGEYGEEWHAAGTKLTKQTVFDDFIAAGEWLVANKWTSSDKLAIQGGSNGGLLVGAVLNQRPELFGAALPAVGVMDMLRFEQFTIGWAWTSDYGSVKDADEFAALRAYSPYHNINEAACYPPVLITTADHDDRVVPAHSFKYAAALQHAQGCANPVLIRIETRAGHGAGKPTTKQIEEQADIAAFLIATLGVE